MATKELKGANTGVQIQIPDGQQELHNQKYSTKAMLKVLNFNCDVFSSGNACSFKDVANFEIYKSICFDGRGQSHIFSSPFIYDSHIFNYLWRSQWSLITPADTLILSLAEIKDLVWHLAPQMNIAV